MSTQYKHLSTEERVTIMVMLFQQQTLRAIAALLGRHPSTISREIKRTPQQSHYDADRVGSPMVIVPAFGPGENPTFSTKSARSSHLCGSATEASCIRRYKFKRRVSSSGAPGISSTPQTEKPASAGFPPSNQMVKPRRS